MNQAFWEDTDNAVPFFNYHSKQILIKHYEKFVHPELEIEKGVRMKQNDKHLSHAMLLLAHIQTPETHEAGGLSTCQHIVYLHEEPRRIMKTTA